MKNTSQDHFTFVVYSNFGHVAQNQISAVPAVQKSAGGDMMNIVSANLNAQCHKSVGGDRMDAAHKSARDARMDASFKAHQSAGGDMMNIASAHLNAQGHKSVGGDRVDAAHKSARDVRMYAAFKAHQSVGGDEMAVQMAIEARKMDCDHLTSCDDGTENYEEGTWSRRSFCERC
jgi:hypothetical protein